MNEAEIQWQSAVGVFGVSALRYVLAAAPEQSTTQDAPPANLSAQQAVMLASLATLADDLRKEADTSRTQSGPSNGHGRTDPEDMARGFFLTSATTRVLGEYLPGFGCTRMVATRREAGGQIESRTSTDPVVEKIFAVLADLYPLTLLPATRPFLSLFSTSAYLHPSRSEFDAEVLADPALSLLFPDGEGLDRTGPYMGPNRGTTNNLSMFASSVLDVAVGLARLDAVEPTFAQVADQADEVLRLLRLVALGETVHLPARVALTGVRLPSNIPEMTIEVADPEHADGSTRAAVSVPVRVRRRDERDDWLVSHTGIHGDLATNRDDREIVISYAGNVIIEMNVPYKAHLTEFTNEEWPADLRALGDPLRRCIEDVRLALALVEVDDTPIVALEAWSANFDLLSSMPNVGWSDLSGHVKLSARELTPTQVERWRHWTRHLSETDATSWAAIAVARRRLLAAATERHAPEDVLIDSVMVWENLVGAETETVFRVCASIACLLTESLEDRRALLKELKAVYTVRSKVVHGATDIGRKDADKPPRALEVAAELLRVLVQDRPELLAERDARTRSDRILLGH